MDLLGKVLLFLLGKVVPDLLGRVLLDQVLGCSTMMSSGLVPLQPSDKHQRCQDIFVQSFLFWIQTCLFEVDKML